MTTPAVHIIGMPYVPGTARGKLQRGMQGNPAGKIVMLEQPLTDTFELLPAGFVMVDGAPLSHSLIPLLGSGVPCILITLSQARGLQAGMELILDGTTGLLTTDLSVHVSQRELPVTSTESATHDGVAVSLRVSARSQRAVQYAVESSAEAIGLLRSEFLVPEDGRLPDADFYTSAFQKLCETAAGLPLTIRLFDVAASKLPSWLLLPPTGAGVLGRQGVRLYVDEPVHGIYRAQLQAIAAVAAECEVRVLLPFVADLEELQYWCDDIKRQLACPVAVGAMAETPAAALQLREWLEVVEFVAIGCNDLMQCLFGADRDQNYTAISIRMRRRSIGSCGRSQMLYMATSMRSSSAVYCRSCRESCRCCWVSATARFQWRQPCCRTYGRLLPARIQQKHACLQRGYVLHAVPLPSANYWVSTQAH